jgi:glycosidase
LVWAVFFLIAAAALAANPTSVTVAGDLQSEAGCGGDWDPGCAATHLTYDVADDVWQGTFNLPAGNYQYKAALNNSWDENYGLHAVAGGDNIPLNLAGGQAVKFYFDYKSHWITDNVSSVIATVPGSYQSEIGCPGDWDPGCLRSWLEDPKGTGTYSFTTPDIPAGNYEAKVAINESWDLNYGQGGVPGGANILFTVAVTGPVTFIWDPNTHILTVQGPGSSHDNNVEFDGLRHDSRDTLYRSPGGAVPAGSDVKVRLRTFHNDVTDVKMRLFDLNSNVEDFRDMKVVASDVSCYQDDLSKKTCDYWETTLHSDVPNNYWYRFIVTDGSKTAYYADDTPALDGGLGKATDNIVDNSYALMFYDKNFKSAAWAKDAVIYQIFPDRFRNGRANNDPHSGDVRYDDPVLSLPWGTLPEGHCRSYSDAASTCPWRFDATQPAGSVEGARGRDYMGGDLKGIDQQMDYLSWLGVNTIYMNPIFDSGSNHGYDTQDYTKVDPYFGTQKDFENLAKHATQNKVRLILDGVFNHLSSDSVFFDRYHHYAAQGACESTSSPFRNWFTFSQVGGTGVCAPYNGGVGTTNYTGWGGFDSIPVITKSLPAVQNYFLTGPNSISKYWLQQGASGWRLDVMGDSSFPNGYWESFRNVVKQTKPDALIISELWQKDSTLLRFLRGDRADATMNYRLRDAVIALLAPQNFDSKGFADSGYQIKPSQFAARMLSQREDYPDATYYSLMNLLDSHDTARLLWVLTPGGYNRAEREFNAANLAEGKLRVKLASLLQFSVPGSPTVYYGDEVGLTGADDPDDRRTYPWDDLGGTPDYGMRDHYRGLIAVRKQVNALRAGDLRVLLADDDKETVAIGRKTGTQAAITIVNRSTSSQTISVPVSGYIHDGVQFTALFSVGNAAGTTFTTAGGTLQATLQPESGLLVATGMVDLTPPDAPQGLKVTKEGSRNVELLWTASADAAGYNVYRSFVSGGGWEKANTTLVSTTNYMVSDLTDGTTYFFVVKAVDAVGNESDSSNEVSGIPHLTIGWANLQWPPTMTHTISASTPTDLAYGQVWIDGETNKPGATPGLQAQLGFGPAGSKPAGNSAWTWVDATFNNDAGNNDEYKASMLPSAVGTYDYAYRYSTTKGRDWLYADLNGPEGAGDAPLPNPGKLTVTASGDTTPPAVPNNLRVTGASLSIIDLAWDAVTGDPTMYGYEVWRSDASAGPFTAIGSTTSTTFSDTNVVANGKYYYVVQAVDQSFNHSNNSNMVVGEAKQRKVTLSFVVAVPASTDGTGRAVHIAGFLDRLDGGYPQWDPTGGTMTRVDATHWMITFTGNEGTNLEYKYVLGDWNFVEKDAGCGEIGNRLLTLSYGSNGTQTVNDTAANWRNVAPCGN